MSKANSHHTLSRRGVLQTIGATAMLSPLTTRSQTAHASFSALIYHNSELKLLTTKLIEITDLFDSANSEADQIFGVYVQQRPRKPSVLRWRPQDGGICGYMDEVIDGKRVLFCAPGHIKQLRDNPIMRQEFIGTQKEWDALPIDKPCPEDMKHLFEMRPAGGSDQKRADELVAAFDAYEAKDAAIRAELGLDEANARTNELHEQGEELVEKIIALPARDIAGLQAKAQAIHAWCFAGEAVDPDDYDTTDSQMMAGMLRDILQMQSH